MANYVKITEAAKMAQIDSDYLHKLIKQGKLPARFEQKGKLKYWYVDTDSPRFQKLLSRLQQPKKTKKTPKLQTNHPIEWDVWEAMCKRGEEIVKRRCTPRTIRNYRDHIERFFAKYPLLNRDTLRQALAAYEARETPERDFYTPKSHMYFALMTIAKYFVHLGYETSELIKSLEYLRPKKGHTVVSRKCFTEATIRDVVQKIQTAWTERNAPAYNDYNTVLNVALIYTAFFTAARSSEICGIRLQDVDFKTGSIRLFGKGGKERYVGLSSELRQAIEAYLKIRPD